MKPTEAKVALKKEENKKRFFQNIFCLSKAENSAVANEIIRLCSIILPVYQSHFSEINSLIEESNKYKNNKPVHLSDVYENLRESNLLMTDYLTAFISVQMEHMDYCHKQYDQYKALALLTAMQLSYKGDNDHERLCNELRQIALGNREELIDYLPNILIADFSSLINELEKLQHAETLSLSPISGQLSNIKAPFQSVYHTKKRVRRDVKSRAFKKEGRLQASKQEYVDDVNTLVTEIKELKFGDNYKDRTLWLEEEEQSSTSRTLTIISSPADINKDYAVQAIQARAINENIRKKRMMLTCDIYRVTPYDLHCLVTNCITSLRNDDQHRTIAQALLLMLITGNTFKEMLLWKPFRKSTHNIVGIKRKFKLPTHDLNKKLDPFLKKVTEDYSLLLPLNLVSNLNNFEFKGTQEKDLKMFLSALNKSYGIKLTLNKVASYLPQTFKANGIDCTIIDLITGYDVSNQPARFYTHIPYKALYSGFDRYLSHLGKAGKTNFLDDREKIDTISKNQNLGSPLFIDTTLLQFLFSNIQSELKNIPQNHITYFSEKSHNRRLLYLQLVLGIASGYRPVDGWFGNIDDIHFSSGEYRIAEKERTVGYTGRTVVLPKIALTHILQYIDYCKRGAIHFYQSKPKLARRYEQSTQGDMPFSFYRHQEAIQETKPSTYMQHIKQIFPFPENWTRHYLRSLLFSQNISDELIGAWMGHIHSNQLPFAQFSQLNRKKLHIVRDLLEIHITNLLSGEIK